MQEIDINTLINKNNCLNENIPNDIIIVGKINNLKIKYKYDQLDLSRMECYEIIYHNQKGESIQNHILPNSLKSLYCCSGSQLTLLPNLPDSLEELYCFNNKLISLPDHLPNSLKCLRCYNNNLTSLPNLPDSLKELDCSGNQLTSLPELPDSLQYLKCYYNKLTSFPNLNMLKTFIGDNKVDYINYGPDYEETKIYFGSYYKENWWHNSYIEIKGYGKITSNEEYIQYMKYRSHKINKIKSARK